MSSQDTSVSRRWLIGALLSGAALPAIADVPKVSPRPAPRPSARAGISNAGTAGGGVSAASAEALIAEAKLSGRIGFVVADARTGQVLEAMNPTQSQPPASVAKAITTLYALDKLGTGYRFATSLIATGSIAGGRLKGDLILAGSGDPTLSSDVLGDLAAALKAKGVSEVTGKFLYWSGALPEIDEIASDQPDHVGYNPSISGLNLNYNRVHFEWKRNGSGYHVAMDARAERFVPQVRMATMKVVNRERPTFTYSMGSGAENWTVASAALGKGGSRWLPVRRSDLYCAEVFQTLARAQGIKLAPPQSTRTLPTGTVIVQGKSDDLRIVLRDMLKYSTNLTAEVIGLSASGNAGSLNASGRQMSAWAKARFGLGEVRFVDHSGLGSASRISAADMVRALTSNGSENRLRGLLKSIPMRDAKGRVIKGHPVKIEAKTGTLNFVSALAGYVSAPGGTELAFAIFTADPARRDAVPLKDREAPPGGAAWIRRARHLQLRLIDRWATVYGG